MKQVNNISNDDLELMAKRTYGKDYSIDRDRWSKMTIFEQMGNISSEVGRAIKAKHQNNSKDLEASINTLMSTP